MKRGRLTGLPIAAAPALFALASFAGCTRPAGTRAERELEVGHATSGTVALDVDEGAAAVRAIGDGSIRLWATAPAFRANLRTDAPRRWQITVENVLPDAELEAGAASVACSRPLPTERVCELDLPASTDVELRLVPKDEPRARFRFLAMGDVQEAIDRVQDIYRRMNEVPGARFLFFVGDQTRRGSLEELERFRVELKGLLVPAYMTLGNHELGDADPPPYFDVFGRASQSFVYGRTAFTLVDSGSATIDPLVEDMLDDWLGAHRDRLHVVGMHIPPIDPVGVRNGAFASRTEAQRALAKLARGNVDLTLYGHVHSFYAFDNADIPAFITGGGGAIPERFDGVGRHFLTVDVDPDRSTLDVGLVRVDVDD